jgi:predicted alpha/beta-fold hydrolase
LDFVPFRPLPLLGNPHVQTVLGNLLAGTPARLPSQAREVALPDGDCVVLHDTTPAGWRDDRPVAVLVHGLGGCHQSGYVQRMAYRLASAGARVYRMDLRGCGAGIGLAKRYYNANCSADVRAVVEHLQARHPAAPLVLAGFSLGGGIVLKMTGEAASAPLENLCAVAAVAPPLDLLRCSDLISRLPFYDSFYVRHLTAQVYRHQRLHPDVAPIRFPRRLTLRQFDEIYTAPRWGFAGAADYYARASALPWVARIDVPTLILTARDDPFVAVESFESLAPNPHVRVHVAAAGGHLGFLGPDGAGGVRWAERHVADWLLSRARTVADRLSAGHNGRTSPVPTHDPRLL